VSPTTLSALPYTQTLNPAEQLEGDCTLLKTLGIAASRARRSITFKWINIQRFDSFHARTSEFFIRLNVITLDKIFRHLRLPQTPLGDLTKAYVKTPSHISLKLLQDEVASM
jgi:hypothetical protein